MRYVIYNDSSGEVLAEWLPNKYPEWEYSYDAEIFSLDSVFIFETKADATEAKKALEAFDTYGDTYVICKFKEVQGLEYCSNQGR